MRKIVVLLILCISPFIKANEQDIAARLAAVEAKMQNAEPLNVIDGQQQAALINMIKPLLEELMINAKDEQDQELKMREIEELASEL